MASGAVYRAGTMGVVGVVGVAGATVVGAAVEAAEVGCSSRAGLSGPVAITGMGVDVGTGACSSRYCGAVTGDDMEAQVGRAKGMGAGMGRGGAAKDGARWANTAGKCEAATCDLKRMRASENWVCPGMFCGT